MVRRSRYVHGLGLGIIAVAAAQSLLKVAGGGSSVEALIDFVLLGLTGALFLYVGSWLSESEIEPDLYRRIATWSLAGVGVMLAFLVLRALHPGIPTEFTFGTRAVALAIGSAAGLGIGIHESRAISREREIERRNDALERVQDRLEERNDELRETQQELEATVRELEASNERLEQFASAASHDLQEPLRMISSYLRLLEERYGDELDEDAEEFIEFAVDGADRMQVMVDDLLEYSRVETRGDPFEPVDLDAVLDDALTDLGVRVEETDAEITAEELPRVAGDRSQLRQLFQNLVSNALEYSGDEPPRVHVSAERVGDRWEIAVCDEGIGIDPEDQERIFEVFDRLHTQADHEGTGIGLALCQRIAERHDGTLEVDSEPGEGATFSVLLQPVEEAPAR
ncbi:integral membrane sensor signal transduction histidine kinase [Natronococcus amylolyticus DSM 10524]|uniref:histidine kinase n=1 Tax=Natronococcus amylolyticus DSM 10524 TaxID=1227497 RepID=L9WZF9_9EURY|nr:ATP-binding protein [Natronococcus amylolyticus]ELY54787.1 integral membrane sensor signal transduction histidine kinase [Natronococcus amylolyticus DSM 10524]